ncbi:MAG: HD domain-containing protein [Clostridiaceae bacterium]|nr:HD domain-containing protein [Clostridiaceae bacterium]
MSILDLKQAQEKGKVSQGTVFINVLPSIRTGKNGEFMVGQFLSQDGQFDFRIWEEEIFSTVQANGTGIYDVEVIGAEYNGFYFTVRKIEVCHNPEISKYDFLPSIPREQINQNWKRAVRKLNALGVSKDCWNLLEEIIKDPEIKGRFTTEGAAIYYHDNKIGGLVNHTIKMLNILAAMLENNPELLECADLLTFSIMVHDIGKVFEYEDLAPAKFWYANHRVRGIEFIANYKDAIIELFDETFYRQVQSVISGHHGDYGDRPTTVAAAIVHYIDTLESQTTGILQHMENLKDDNFKFGDWGFIEPLPIGRFKSVPEDSPEALEAYFTTE